MTEPVPGVGTPIVPTRQLPERVVSTTTPLPGAGKFVSQAFRAEGYNSMLGLVVADQPGTLRVLQAGETKDAKGNTVPDIFVQTNVVATAVDPFTGRSVAQINAPITGVFVQLEYDNGGTAQGQFNLVGYLIPSGSLANVTATVIIPPMTAVEIKDSATTTELSVQQDGAAVPAGEDGGGLLIAGRDGANQFHVRMAQAAIAGNETLEYVLTRAAVSGINTGAAATAQLTAVEARTPTSLNGLLTGFGLNGLLSLSVLFGQDLNNAAQTRAIAASTITGFSGAGQGAWQGIVSIANAFGFDSLNSAFRQIEGRSDTVLAGTAFGPLFGLHTLAQAYGNDVQNTQYLPIGAVRDLSNVSTKGLFGQLEARQNGYWAAVQSRRFAAKHGTEGGNLTAQATYVATTPTLLLANAAAAVRAIMRTLFVGIDSATTNPVRIVIKIDSADRRSVAGTAITPQNTNSGGGASAITSFQENPTATAEGGGTKRQYEFIMPSGKGVSSTINVNDEEVIGTTGSWLVYVFDDAGASGPSILWNVSYEEAA